MAISVVATGSASVSSSRSPSINFSSYTPAENDLVVFLCNRNSQTSANITVPSGWGNCHPSGGNNNVVTDAHAAAMVYHVVTSGEASGGTTTYTCTNLWNSNTTGNVVGLVLRGVDPAAPIDSSNTGSSNTNNASPHVFPSLTGSNLSDNSMVVRGVAKDGTGTWTTPSGHTSRATSNTNQGTALYTRDALTTAGNNVSSTNITPNSGDEYIAFSVAFTEYVGSGSSGGGGSEPPAFRSAALTAGSSSSSRNVTVPSGVSAGDGVLVFFWVFPYTATVTSVPSGFTELDSSPSQCTLAIWSAKLYAYRHRATGPESGSYTFTISGQDWSCATAVAYSGIIDDDNFVDVDASAFTTNNTAAPPALSVTTTVDNTRLVYISHSNDNYDSQMGTPSGFTSRILSNFGDNTRRVSDKVQETAGGSGNVTIANMSPVNPFTAFLVALKPPPPADEGPVAYIHNGSQWVASATPRIRGSGGWTETTSLPLGF